MAILDRFKKGKREAQATSTSVDAEEHFVVEGKLDFVVEQGGNGSKPSYQEVTGAPVEITSPLGLEVGPITILFLNISKMVGTGIYSTRKLSHLSNHIV
jgi:hypothetical protein